MNSLLDGIQLWLDDCWHYLGDSSSETARSLLTDALCKIKGLNAELEHLRVRHQLALDTLLQLASATVNKDMDKRWAGYQ